MKRLGLTCAVFFALSFVYIGANAQSARQSAADELVAGCVDRAKVEKYISDHNYAELLRGKSSDGRTHGVWTNGRQIIMIDYARPADDEMDQLKTICVSGTLSNISFNLYVIERLVSSAVSASHSK